MVTQCLSKCQCGTIVEGYNFTFFYNITILWYIQLSVFCEKQPESKIPPFLLQNNRKDDPILFTESTFPYPSSSIL